MQARGPSTVQDCRAFLSIVTFDLCFLQGTSTCVKQSLLYNFYWNKNTLDVLKIHDLIAIWVIFYLICVAVNLVMTALATDGQDLLLVPAPGYPPHAGSCG